MKKIYIFILCLLMCGGAFGGDGAEFDPYNGRVLAYEELSSANVAVSDFIRRIASKHYGLYSTNGILKINILFANNNGKTTCVVVMSARDDVRGGAGEYCVDNQTKKIISFKKTK